MRRLPVYILVDGELLANADAEQQLLVARRQLEAIDSALVRLFVFAETAYKFGVGTRAGRESETRRALGAALRTVSGSLEQETRRRTGQDLGDFQPLIFILAGGVPDDDWLAPASALRTLVDLRFANVVAVAFVEEAAPALSHITSSVLAANRAEGVLADCLAWIVATVSTTARLADRGSTRHKLIRAPAIPPTLRSLSP